VKKWFPEKNCYCILVGSPELLKLNRVSGLNCWKTGTEFDSLFGKFGLPIFWQKKQGSKKTQPILADSV
jgi:hypothetical protein